MVRAVGQGLQLKAELTLRQHEAIAGLRETLGGHDEGPNPHEWLEGALAACTTLTLELYAKRKGVALERVAVAVNIVEEGAETRIARTITLEGTFTNEERERLIQIAEKCPIHRLLTSHVTIETTAAD